MAIESRHFMGEDGCVHTHLAGSPWNPSGKCDQAGATEVQVTPLSELPPVVPVVPAFGEAGYKVGGTFMRLTQSAEWYEKTAATYRRDAARLEAAAKFVRERPPVDKDAVVEMHRLIDQHSGSDRSLAEHLVRSGVRVEKQP